MKPSKEAPENFLQLLTNVWSFVLIYIWNPIRYLFSPPKVLDSEIVRSISEIPGPYEWPLLGDALKLGKPERFLDYVSQLHQKYGHIVKVKLGPQKFVFINDPMLCKEIIRKEPRCPLTFKLPASEALVEKHKITRGLFFQNGENWYQQRSLLTQLLLKNTGTFMETIFNSTESVLQEQIQNWASKSVENDGIIPHIELDCYKTFISMILALTFGPEYRKYLQKVDLDETNLAKIAIKLLSETFSLNACPIKIAQSLGMDCWKRYEEYTLYNINKGRELTDLMLKTMNNSEGGGSLEKFGLLHRMKNHCKATDEDIRVHCTDFTFDVSDPVSITMLWSLQALGRNLEAQKKIFEEIESVCEHECVGYKDIEKMPYLKAYIKEVFRMYPAAYLTIREHEEEIVVGGFKVPSDYTIALSTFISQRNPDHFPEPDKLKPERWLQDESHPSSRLDGHAYHPFGIGKRECAGKGVATGILRLVVASVVQNFIIESEEVKAKMQIVLYPDQPVKIKLRQRKEKA